MINITKKPVTVSKPLVLSVGKGNGKEEEDENLLAVKLSV